MAKPGKRVTALQKKVDGEKTYSLEEGVRLVKENAVAKFDETVEIVVNLGIDPKQSDQSVRGMVAMPHGVGKTIRVAVIARGDKVDDAKKAGADLAGGDDLADEILAGKIDFDRLIATPDMMAVVGKLGKVLGPRGLMPNPKLGTVTPNVADAVKAAKSGQVEFRIEKAAIVHAGIGKASFKAEQLVDNIRAFMDALVKAKPAAAKGTYIKRIGLSSTMGPGVRVSLDAEQAAAA